MADGKRDMQSGEKRASYVLTAGRTFAARAALIAINIAYILLLAKWLGAEKYGLLMVAIATAAVFLNLSLAGTNWSLGVEAARRPDDVAHIAPPYVAARMLTVGIAVATCVIWGFAVHGGQDVATLVAAFAIAIAPRSFAMLHIAILLGQGRSDTAVFAELGARTLEILLVALGLFWLGLGLHWVAASAFLAWGVSWFALRTRTASKNWSRPDFSKLWTVIAASLPFGLLSLGISWLNQSAIFTAPTELQPPEALGWIALAVNLVVVAAAVLQSILSPLAPRLAASAEDGSAFLPIIGGIGFAAAALIAVIGDLGLRHIAPLVVPPLLGDDYRGLSTLHVEIALMVSGMFALIWTSSLAGYHRRRWTAGATVLLGVVAVLAILVALPEQQMAGATLLAAAAGGWTGALLLGMLIWSNSKPGRPALALAALLASATGMALAALGRLNAGLLGFAELAAMAVLVPAILGLVRRLPPSGT